MKRFLPVMTAFLIAAILIQATGPTASAPPTQKSTDPLPGSIQERATFEMQRIERLAADPKSDPDQLWQELVDYRHHYSAQPQALRAGELMAKVRSPLDVFDHKHLPKDCPSWLPEDVVAVVGEHRGRDYQCGLRVSPDGKWIVATGGSGLHVWDAATLDERKAFFNGFCGDWSRDGKVLAVGGKDDRVRLYDVAGSGFRETATLKGEKWPPWKEEAPIRGEGWHVEAIRLGTDGKRLITLSVNYRFGGPYVLRVWDLAGKLPQEKAAFDALTLGDRYLLLPDAQRLLCEVYSDRKPWNEPGLVLWDVSGEKPREEDFLGGCRFPAALAPDGRTLAARRSETDTVQLWDIGGTKPRPLRLVPGEFPHLVSLTFSLDSNVLVCGLRRDKGGRDVIRQIPINDAGSKQLGLAKDSPYLETDLSFDWLCEVQAFPDGKTLAVGEATIRLWDMAKKEARFPAPRGHRGNVTAAALSLDGKTLCTGSGDGSVGLWQLDKDHWQLRQMLPGFNGFVWVLALSPDGNWLATITDRKVMELWQVSEKGLKKRATFEPHSLQVYSVAFSADSASLVTGGADRGPINEKDRDGWDGRQLSVRLWNLAGNKPTERLVAVPKSRPAEAGQEGYDPMAHGVGDAFSAVLSPDTRLLACAAGGAARTWKIGPRGAEEQAVINNVKLQDYNQHLLIDKERIDCVALSPDGKIFATGGYSPGDENKPVIYLWDLTESPPRKVHELAGVPRRMHQLVFSGDGKTLFSAWQWVDTQRWSMLSGKDRTSVDSCDPYRKIIRWDVATGRQIGVTEVPVPFNMFALAPDGRHLLTANKNGTAYLFRLPPAKKPD